MNSQFETMKVPFIHRLFLLFTGRVWYQTQIIANEKHEVEGTYTVISFTKPNIQASAQEEGETE